MSSRKLVYFQQCSTSIKGLKDKTNNQFIQYIPSIFTSNKTFLCMIKDSISRQKKFSSRFSIKSSYAYPVILISAKCMSPIAEMADQDDDAKMKIYICLILYRKSCPIPGDGKHHKMYNYSLTLSFSRFHPLSTHTDPCMRQFLAVVHTENKKL